MIDSAITRYLLGTATLGSNLCGVSSDALSVWGELAIAVCIHRFILEDAVDGDTYDITVRIGHTLHLDWHEFVVRRPYQIVARYRYRAIRGAVGPSVPLGPRQRIPTAPEGIRAIAVAVAIGIIASFIKSVEVAPVVTSYRCSQMIRIDAPSGVRSLNRVVYKVIVIDCIVSRKQEIDSKLVVRVCDIASNVIEAGRIEKESLVIV